MRRTAAQGVLEDRGVYWAPHTKRGRPVLYAVTSSGDRLMGLILMPESSGDDAIDYLWRELDRQDPVRPPLRLVKDDEPAPPLTWAGMKEHPMMDALTWDRIQRDDNLRRRVLKQLRAFDAAYRRNA